MRHPPKHIHLDANIENRNKTDRGEQPAANTTNTWTTQPAADAATKSGQKLPIVSAGLAISQTLTNVDSLFMPRRVGDRSLNLLVDTGCTHNLLLVGSL